jgi:hypothetical protein
MPKQTLATAAITTVALEPDMVARVAAKLSTYHTLKVDADLLYEAMAKELADIKGEMELAGVNKMEIDGTPCTIVTGETSSLNKLKFVELGGSLEMLENATVHKPRKAYLRVGKEK